MGNNRDASGRFLPGQSGNPGGRPKVAPELRAAAQEVSLEGLKVLTVIMRDEKAPQNARINAVQAIWDRGFGKPDQQHRVSGQINFAHLLAEYTQQRLATEQQPELLEEGGELEILDESDDEAKLNGNGAAEDQ